MTLVPVAAVHVAATRLRGHLVAAPLIGGVRPGGDGGVDLRWKPDLMQPGGSGWFRGFQHLLLRSYGALPGVSFVGRRELVLAAAIAAHQHRLAFTAFLGADPEVEVLACLRAIGAAVEIVAEPMVAAAALQRRNGHVPMPGSEHPDVAAGMATVGLELAGSLPTDCAAIYAPTEWVEVTQAGLLAAGRNVPVVAVGGDGAGPGAGIPATVLLVHRLALSERGAAVLLAALGHPGGGTVGALVAD